MRPRPPPSPLFPYTTLFRSFDSGYPGYRGKIAREAGTLAEMLRPHGCRNYMLGKWHVTTAVHVVATRSEEHTSELQSLTNLVCRLLLDKKNTTRAPRPLPFT